MASTHDRNLRREHERQQDAARQRAAYDAYPDDSYVPRVQIWLHAFAADGSEVDREWVATDGYSFREYLPSLARDDGPHGRRWLIDAAIRAHARLVARLGPPSAGGTRDGHG